MDRLAQAQSEVKRDDYVNLQESQLVISRRYCKGLFIPTQHNDVSLSICHVACHIRHDRLVSHMEAIFQHM